jgi:penicillin amidase
LFGGEVTANELAQAARISVAEVEAQQRRYLEAKLPLIDGAAATTIGQGARIARDRWGVAHISAGSLEDGYYALGYAMGQDRLWQLDYMRRRAQGRLAEVMGAQHLYSDRFYRTIGLGSAAAAAAAQMSTEIGRVLAALAAGINAVREAAGDQLPLEFDLLDYQPQAWTPVDSIAVWKWRWWSLTGRLEVLAQREACKRYLSEEFCDVFLGVEAGEETIVPGDQPAATGGYDSGEGSNNWVVGGSRTVKGKPVLATDPHNSLDHPSQWYEAQLSAPGMDVIGAFYLGTPGIYLGHTRQAAWGLTNHTSSARDLYVEQVRPDDAQHYLQEDKWVPFAVERQEIAVKGQASIELEILHTVRGPVVNDFVQSISEQGDPPLSLRWAGVEPDSGFAAMLGLMRAQSVDQVLEALRQWTFPNLNFVFADTQGRIGYHAVGTAPLRHSPWRGFRPAAEAAHQWQGKWDFDALPQLIDPARDWVGSANNPPWGGQGAYLALGNWSDGYRFKRIRERIEAAEKMDAMEVGAIHGDVLHARARELAPVLAAWARQSAAEDVRRLAEIWPMGRRLYARCAWSNGFRGVLGSLAPASCPGAFSRPLGGSGRLQSRQCRTPAALGRKAGLVWRRGRGGRRNTGGIAPGAGLAQRKGGGGNRAVALG